MAEQAAQRTAELDRLKAELSEVLRDSMEAAHQAELLESQVSAKHARYSNFISYQTVKVVISALNLLFMTEMN